MWMYINVGNSYSFWRVKAMSVFNVVSSRNIILNAIFQRLERKTAPGWALLIGILVSCNFFYSINIRKGYRHQEAGENRSPPYTDRIRVRYSG